MCLIGVGGWSRTVDGQEQDWAPLVYAIGLKLNSWRATVFHQTAAWKFLVMLKTLISWIRCVLFGLEQNCAELLPSRNCVWDQWFSNLSCKHPCGCPAHFVCLPYQTHLIQLISTFVETAKPELGVSDKGDIKNVQGRGACRTGLKTTSLHQGS